MRHRLLLTVVLLLVMTTTAMATEIVFEEYLLPMESTGVAPLEVVEGTITVTMSRTPFSLVMIELMNIITGEIVWRDFADGDFLTELVFTELDPGIYLLHIINLDNMLVGVDGIATSF